MTMTGGVDGASLKIGAKSFTEEALLAAITKIELGNPEAATHSRAETSSGP
jgi:glycine betaine/choline ABC-type transport system substrate-binding protein